VCRISDTFLQTWPHLALQLTRYTLHDSMTSFTLAQLKSDVD